LNFILYFREMKFLTKIVLVLFLTFQFLPAIIAMVDNEKSAKISFVLLDDEEESSKDSKENKELKEFKTEFLEAESNFDFVYFTASNKLVKDNYLLKNYHSKTSLPLLPPEQV